MRSSLRWLAIVAFAILIPIAAHSLWDYVEVRRLVREIEAIRAKGEPVRERDAVGGTERVPSEEPSAGSYYLAGGMLALRSSSVRVTTPIREWLAEPNPDREALAKLAPPLQALVRDSRDALMLADRAGQLPFDGFAAGTGLQLPHGQRELSLGVDHGAHAQLERRGRWRRGRRFPDRWSADPARASGNRVDVRERAAGGGRAEPVAAHRRRAGAAARPPWRRRMAEEQGLEDFLRQRARALDATWLRYYGSNPNAPERYTLPMRSLTETVMRPRFTHDTVAGLRLWAELTEVVKLPWPEKGVRSSEILARYRDDQPQRTAVYTPISQPRALGAFSQAVDATPLILDRSSRVAVAVERFRRDRAALPGALTDLVPAYFSDVPADPHSGRPLLFRPAAGAYTIYSVGPDQKDDGGDLTSETPEHPGARLAGVASFAERTSGYGC